MQQESVTLNLADLSVFLSEEFDISVSIDQLIVGMAIIQSTPTDIGEIEEAEDDSEIEEEVEEEEEDLSFIVSDDEYMMGDGDYIPEESDEE